MSDPFGVVASAIGIAAAFNTCVDCFNYVQLGRHFSRDFETKALTLTCLQLRLTRWGQVVNVYADPKLGNPNATQAELDAAKDILVQILTLFADTEKLCHKYKTSARDDDATTYPAANMHPTPTIALDAMRQLIVRRQKPTSLLKRTTWALFHHSEFADLIEDVSKLVDNLERLFPGPPSELQRLAEQELSGVKDKQALELIEEAAEGVDPTLQIAAAKHGHSSHHYADITVRGKAQLGNKINTNWTRGVEDSSHDYGNVTVEKGAQSLMGDNYGGKDFWDSE